MSINVIMKGDILYAYVAGIVDGEGCIDLHVNGKRKCGKNNYAIRLTVGNTNQWVIEMLHMQFGGHVSIGRKKDTNPLHSKVYVWEVSSLKAYKVLNLVIPFLQIKKQQALLAIQYQNRRKHSRNTALQDQVLDEADYILLKSYKTHKREVL
jgi:hypothetical protein